MLERGGRFENCADAGNKEEIDDWFPVYLWLGAPGFGMQVDMETAGVARLSSTFGSNTGGRVALVVGRRQRATKTNQTVDLTVGIGQPGETGMFWQGVKYIIHEALVCWHGCSESENTG